MNVTGGASSPSLRPRTRSGSNPVRPPGSARLPRPGLRPDPRNDEAGLTRARVGHGQFDQLTRPGPKRMATGNFRTFTFPRRAAAGLTKRGNPAVLSDLADPTLRPIPRRRRRRLERQVAARCQASPSRARDGRQSNSSTLPATAAANRRCPRALQSGRKPPTARERPESDRRINPGGSTFISPALSVQVRRVKVTVAWPSASSARRYSRGGSET